MSGLVGISNKSENSNIQSETLIWINQGQSDSDNSKDLKFTATRDNRDDGEVPLKGGKVS